MRLGMSGGTVRPLSEPTRIVRVIARLNIGGPAIQAISLTRMLEPHGYATTLVRGREDPHEGSMDYLARDLGVEPLRVASLRRDPGVHDLAALARVTGMVARRRPEIVHTHAAKAGTIGRLAALSLPRSRRPVIVHTFHGHSLTGYFPSRQARAYLAIERFLARRSDRLIAVSEEVRAELLALGVGEQERFEVIPLGFDLSSFNVNAAERARRRERLRAELGIPDDARLITQIARLVPIKRVDRFLRLASRLADRPDAHFLVVGDGELREQLRSSTAATALDGRLTWAGFRRDIADVCFASDVVVLTSDNEGTPVSLIEAQAATTPVVGTRVGGVASVVSDGYTGFTVDATDEQGLAGAVARVLDDQRLAGALAAAGREQAQRFSLAQLVDRLDRLYRRLLAERRAPL
jgi:glycosyltransferase involved in cell wall biosynthesis